MAGLSDEERATCERRAEYLMGIQQDAAQYIADLAELYGVCIQSGSPVDYAWIAEQLEEPLKWEDYSNLADGQLSWLGARLSALIGEHYRFKWKGKWRVQTNRSDPYFLHIVVDRFEEAGKEELSVSPATDALYFIRSEPGRSLARLVADRNLSS